MKKLFTGTFTQVEEAISVNFAKNTIKNIERLNFLMIIIFLVFFVGLASYALFGVSTYIGTHMNELVVRLDDNNEFITIFSNIWYMHIQAMFILTIVIGALLFRKKNKIKAAFIYNVFLTIFILFFLLYFFKFTQLFVSSSPLRTIYTILLIVFLLYTFVTSYKNAIEMVHGTAKKRSLLVEWFSENQKKVTSVLITIGGVYYLSKVIFPEAGDLETRLIGSLAEFLPLFSIFGSLIFLYLNNVAIRNYYLLIYSEEYRKKFGIAEADWYGEKYKG